MEYDKQNIHMRIENTKFGAKLEKKLVLAKFFLNYLEKMKKKRDNLGYNKIIM